MSTVEILIALAVFTISTTATVMAAFGNQSAIVDTSMHRTAISLAQELLTENRATAASNWDAVVSTTTHSGPFTENLVVSDADDFMKSLVSTVSWQSGNIPYAVTLTTFIADIADATTEGACAATATGNWTHPTIASTIDLGSTGALTGVDVKDGIAYVTADGNGTLPDFFAVNVATSSPTILWSLDTGPGLMSVHVAGNYAYVANTSINAQLEIINLTTHTIIKYKLPGSGSGDTATTLYYDHQHVYLGTPKSTKAEFHIIDVTDPSAPHEVGTWEFGVGINAIYVSDDIAYVATPATVELQMLDVHDPTHPSSLGGFDATGSSGNGNSLARSGGRLYLGRTVGNNELYSLDINNLSHGSIGQAKIGSSVNSIATIGNLLFLATTDSTKEFQIWQATNDTSLAAVAHLDLPEKATAIDCEGQTIYLTTDTPSRGLLVITAPS
jgi:hypothetical protein